MKKDKISLVNLVEQAKQVKSERSISLVNLVEQAKQVKSERSRTTDYTTSHFELAIALLKGEIDNNQFAVVSGCKGSNSVYRAFTMLKMGISRGDVSITMTQKPKS